MPERSRRYDKKRGARLVEGEVLVIIVVDTNNETTLIHFPPFAHAIRRHLANRRIGGAGIPCFVECIVVACFIQFCTRTAVGGGQFLRGISGIETGIPATGAVLAAAIEARMTAD